MNLEFNFVVDAVVRTKIYPTLARHQAEPYTQSWREFGNHWPTYANTDSRRLMKSLTKVMI